ncbi:MAG: hypothetical protein IJ519_05720, partial [Clostridia bacterium]|nr:hypothetical protein [Clostridia bacterium]
GMDIESLPFDWVPLIDHYRFEKYTDEFFEENAVIVLIDTLGSGTCRHEVFDTTYNGGDLCFGMRKLCEDDPGKAYTLLDTRWITVVEIPKSFLANINTVSIYTERLDPFLSN